MVVKIVNQSRLLCGLVVLALLAGGCCGIQQCKVELLKYFGLSPMKYPIANSMVVCGNIAENCCSMEDEIRIYRLWKRFSVSQIVKHVDLLVKNYDVLFNYHDELLAVDISKIEVKSTEVRKIPIKLKVCERMAHQLDSEEKALNSVDLLNNNALLEDADFKRKLMDSKTVKINSSAKKDKLENIDSGSESLIVGSSSAALINGRILDEEASKHTAEAVSSERELRVVSNNKEKSSGKKSKLTDVEEQLNDDSKALQKGEEKSLRDEQESKSPRSLKLDVLNGTKQDKNADDKKSLETKSTKKKRALAAYEESAYSRPFNFEEELPERKVQCTYVSRVVSKKVTIFNKFKQGFCMDLRQKLTKFKITDFRAYIPDVKIEMSRLMSLKKSFYCYLCDIEKQKRIDSENSIVTFDNHFCRRLIIDFRDYIKFQNVLLIEYIDLVLQYVRCFQTTADEARFPYASFLLMYKRNFETIQKCYDNIDKPEFMKYCVYLCQQYSYTSFSKFFDGNPDLINRILMTLTSFFRKLRANQALSVDYNTIKKEFDLIDSIDFNMSLEDLEAGGDASTVNIGANGKRPSIDISTKDILKAANHKDEKKAKGKDAKGKKVKRSLADERERDAEAAKIAAMSKEQYHNYMLEKTYNQATKVSWEKESEETHSSIYETRSSYKVSKVFRSRFVNDMSALDPLEVEPQLNFDINIKTLFKLQCDKQRKNGDQPEVLQREVIHEYFSANDDDVHSFATDLFMPFADYAFFQQEHEDPKDQKVIL